MAPPTKPTLVVIDMQQGSFTPDIPRHDRAGLVARLNDLAVRVRTAGGKIVFVQHDGPPGDPHHPDQPGWHLLPELHVAQAGTVLRKTACDAFLDTELDHFIAANGVDALIVTGCATDYCVDTTIRSALARGYRTIVPTDGHTTSDRPHLSARRIMAHHHAIWSDFIAPAGPAQLCRCAEVPLPNALPQARHSVQAS